VFGANGVLGKLEALRYKCLRHVSCDLSNFHVLVGPNASGKSTFLDVFAFLSDLVRNGPEGAVRLRTPDCADLLWLREADRFELAVEAVIPKELAHEFQAPGYSRLRYETAVGVSGPERQITIFSETVRLKGSAERGGQGARQRNLFPATVSPPNTIITAGAMKGQKTVVNKVPGGNDNFYPEPKNGVKKGWDSSFKLGPQKSALRNLPDDETRFPASVWLKNFLTNSVQTVRLNASVMRQPSPPGGPTTFRTDGSNLPWVIHALEESRPSQFELWLGHVRSALPDLEGIRTIEREEDRHRYIKLTYANGLEIPSWLVSDGTLRFLAFTILAYLPDLEGVYLIEEPENGIHPKALEHVYRSLSSVYTAQVLVATHSPVFLGLAEPSQILCFAKDQEGATDIVRGDEHPKLKDWRGEVNLGVLLASGVLG